MSQRVNVTCRDGEVWFIQGEHIAWTPSFNLHDGRETQVHVKLQQQGFNVDLPTFTKLLEQVKE